MIRSMYTAISSLSMHQKYLDVVSNNLANANTTGFKTSRVLFQDQFSQTYNSGSSPTTTQGGTNPTQIGLGVMMGYISPNFNQGMLQSTGRNMDLSIQGDGFFIFGKGTDSTYSRAGSMSLDANGILVNSVSGLPAQGWSLATGQTAVDTTQPIGEIKIDTGRSMARATEKVVLGGNFNSVNIGTTNTITVSMGVYDKLGALRKTSIVFTPPATAPATPPTQWTWEAFDDNGTTPASVGTGTIDFDTNGQYSASTPASPLALAISGSDGAGSVPIDIDFTKLTMLSSSTTAAAISQNGVAAGSVTDVYIAPTTGKVSLVFSNGLTSEIGQVAVARFTNPTGLVSSDHTSFLVGVNSGDPEIGTAGTGGRGNIASGYLESSNVDMAQEFTNMILAQRGFQASTKAITTSDEILQELVNLKR
jgi:flagellar hook protein FlgE